MTLLSPSRADERPEDLAVPGRAEHVWGVVTAHGGKLLFLGGPRRTPTDVLRVAELRPVEGMFDGLLNVTCVIHLAVLIRVQRAVFVMLSTDGLPIRPYPPIMGAVSMPAEIGRDSSNEMTRSRLASHNPVQRWQKDRSSPARFLIADADHHTG
jgi:hypothetical protein